MSRDHLARTAGTGRLDRAIWRRVGTAAGAVSFLVFMGCMSFAIGPHYDAPPEGGVLEQEGEASLRQLAEVDVYYPVPYAFPPNLDVTDPYHNAEVLEQRADHFRVRNTCGHPVGVTWKVKGVRYSPAAVSTPPAPGTTEPAASPPPAQLAEPRPAP